jgi:uncharacterized membrane protein
MASLRCGKCGRNNLPDARFCIYCGSPLTPEVRATQEPTPSVAEEIRQLRDLVTQINSRLDALESQQGPAAVPPPPVSVPEQPEMAAVIPEPEPLPETATVVPETGAPPEPVVEALPRLKKPAPKKEREWEQVLGGNWLARIGVLALIIGIGFFLKYAFDNNWLGPSARVILGVIAGLIMLGLGYYWRKRYPVMTRVLSGGGIAVLYLAIFASFATYHLVSVYIAVVLLFIISGIATALALRHDSMALAILGILGAFFAPFILGAFGERAGAGTRAQAIQLLVYIIVVDAVVLVVSTFRNWRWFTLLALACSLITYGFWYGEFSSRVGITAEEIGITAIFLSFVGATYLFHIVWRRVPRVFDYFLMSANAAAYAGISLGLLWDEFWAWMGGFVLLLALFYGLLSYLAYRRDRENTRLAGFSLAIALILLTVAIPVQFRDHAVTTIAWAAEGALLTWLAFREKIQIFRYESYIIFLLVAIRLLGFDTWESGKTLTPIFNERFLAFIFSIAFMWLAAFLHWINRKDEESSGHLVFIAAADFFTVWLIGVELFSYSRQMMTISDSLSLLILLIPAAVMILNPLILRREPSALDNVLGVLNAFALMIFTIFIWRDLRTWMGLAYLLPAIIYGVLASYTLMKGTDYKKRGAFALVIGIVFLTVAIPIQFRDHASTTIAWAIELAALAWLSFRLKLPLLRYCGYAVFAAIFWRLLIYDTTVEIATLTPVLNARFLAYIIAIAAIYLTVYIFWRRRETIAREWRAAAPVLLIAASFLLLWLISFEVWQSFSKSIAAADPAARKGLENAQNLSLTAVWAVYAVAGLVIGIWRKWRYVRIGCLALLVVPIVKVFVYDVFHLETSYRIGAFVGLGLLLLVSAYLYQRYSKIIRGVFTSK